MGRAEADIVHCEIVCVCIVDISMDESCRTLLK